MNTTASGLLHVPVQLFKLWGLKVRVHLHMMIWSTSLCSSLYWLNRQIQCDAFMLSSYWDKEFKIKNTVHIIFTLCTSTVPAGGSGQGVQHGMQWHTSQAAVCLGWPDLHFSLRVSSSQVPWPPAGGYPRAMQRLGHESHFSTTRCSWMPRGRKGGLVG